MIKLTTIPHAVRHWFEFYSFRGINKNCGLWLFRWRVLMTFMNVNFLLVLRHNSILRQPPTCPKPAQREQAGQGEVIMRPKDDILRWKDEIFEQNLCSSAWLKFLLRPWHRIHESFGLAKGKVNLLFVSKQNTKYHIICSSDQVSDSSQPSLRNLASFIFKGAMHLLQPPSNHPVFVFLHNIFKQCNRFISPQSPSTLCCSRLPCNAFVLLIFSNNKLLDVPFPTVLTQHGWTFCRTPQQVSW